MEQLYHKGWGTAVHNYCTPFFTMFIFFQFIPLFRKKMILIHKINGLFLTLLVLFLTSSGFRIIFTKLSQGEYTFSIRTVQLLAVGIFYSYAIYHVIRGNIHQHGLWMQRMTALAITNSLVSVVPHFLTITDTFYFNILATLGYLACAIPLEMKLYVEKALAPKSPQTVTAL